jgi:putative ABC transport system permease protein
MKFLPLIWAALTRKPIRSFLIFASAAIGFTLFGVTIGVNSGMRHLADLARLDRLYVSSRYGTGLTLAQEQEIAGLAGVKEAGAFDSVTGYVERPGNNAAVLMADATMRQVFPELGLKPMQWRALDLAQDGVFLSRKEAARFHLAAGDNLRLITQRPSRRDGASLWTFRVLDVVDDIAFFPAGFALGNFEYLEQARPLAQRGHAGQIWLLISDSDRADAAVQEIEQHFANSPDPVRGDSEKAFLESIGGSTSVLALATEAVAAAGLLMIAFLTGNAIAQSVRERIPEFAVLKTIGFTDRAIIALVFAEAAIPCLTGAALGLAAAGLIARQIPRWMPSAAQFPVPDISPPVVVMAFAAALLIVFVTTALPALRLARLDVATALARKAQ